MIQRIQSVYFLLAGILPAFTFCVPLAKYLDQNGEVVYDLNSVALTSLTGGETSTPWGMMVFAITSIVMAFVCLLSFKNRRMQIAWSNILLTVILLFALTYVAYGYSYGTIHEVRFLPTWGIVFPVLSFLLALLGRRGVHKDEELVRAADRIR